MATTGKLTITVVEAKVTHDTNMCSTMDPFVIIEHRHDKFTSKVCKDGGKAPTFGEDFVIDVKYIGDDMTLRIMNKNTFSASDLVGESVIKISGLCVNGGLDDWWNV